MTVKDRIKYRRLGQMLGNIPGIVPFAKAVLSPAVSKAAFKKACDANPAFCFRCLCVLNKDKSRTLIGMKLGKEK